MITLRYIAYWVDFRRQHKWRAKPLGYRLFRFVHENVDEIAKAMAGRARNIGKLDD